MPEPQISRKIAQGQIAGDQLSAIAVTPQPAIIPGILVSHLDIPIGFMWDVSVIDLAIGLNMFAGAVKVPSSRITAFIRAGSVPVGAFDLDPAGQGGSTGTEYLFRGTFNLPSEVTLLTGDQAVIDLVSTADAGAVAAGTNVSLKAWGADFLMTVYGILTRRN